MSEGDLEIGMRVLEGANVRPLSLTEAAAALYRKMSARRRRQLAAALMLMLLGATAELMTIGAVLPFLALIADPASVAEVPAFEFLMDILRWGGGNLIVTATVILIVVAAVASGIRLLIAWVTQQFALGLGHEISAEIFHRVLHQPYSYFLTRNTSEAISGIEKVNTVIFGCFLPALQAATGAVIAVFIIVLLVVIDPRMATFAAASIAAVYLTLSIISRRILTRNSMKMAASHTARVKSLQEGLGGIRDILLEQSQSVFERKFAKLDRSFRRAQAVNVFLAQAPRFLVEAAGIIIIALLALYMSYRPGGLVASIPTLGALAVGAQRLLPLLQQAYYGWSTATGNTQLLLDVVSLMNRPVSRTARRDRSSPIQEFQRDIVLDDVSFRYSGPDYTLFRVTLSVPKGSKIGIMGETGSGKSTLLDLTMGLLEPSEGEIRVDGVPLDSQTRGEWQAQIAHVPQFIYLSDSSIASNIAFGEPPGLIDMDRVHEAGQRAQLEEFVRSLPLGYETEVGEHGVRLSGGQRQRIGIARALYKKSPVLVLDEATSALDSATEKAVMGSVAALGRELTVFIIAHRLSTLASCDQVIRLERGRLVQRGRFDEMVEPDPSFRHAP